MDRRQILGIASLSLLAAPLTAVAQQTGKVYRIGYVVPAAGPSPTGLAFNRALSAAGLIEGKNVLN